MQDASTSVASDPEWPQVGIKQWTDTYGSKLSADISPTIVDMIGSVRSKIFSIVKIIERYGDRYEVANRHYKILLDALPTKDRVSLVGNTTRVRQEENDKGRKQTTTSKQNQNINQLTVKTQQSYKRFAEGIEAGKDKIARTGSRQRTIRSVSLVRA